MREFKDSISGKDDKPELPPPSADDDHAARQLGPMRLFPRRLRHGEEATLVEHLGELRRRLIICLIAIAVAFVVTYVFHGHILDWLNRPLPGQPAEADDVQPDRAVHDLDLGQPLGGAAASRCRSSSGSSGRSSPRPSPSTTSARWSMLVAFAAVLGARRPRLRLLRDPAAGDPLPDQLRLLALQHPAARQGLLPLRQLRAGRRGARLRGARVRARARPAADPDGGAAAPHLADRRVRDGRDRRDPPGRRPGDDDPLRASRSSLLYVLSIGLATFFEPRWRDQREARAQATES